VLLEAWANGVPNIAYRAGGPAEVIHHETDGLLVKCGDLEGLASALIRLVVQNSELRQQLGRVGQQRTNHEFCWPDKLELVQATYAEAIQGKKKSLS
jgi:L-malate glycosyltransferase